MSNNKKVLVTTCDGERMRAPWLGREVRCGEPEVLHGGICYQVVRLRFGRPPFEAVVKVDATCHAEEPSSLHREAEHLQFVRCLGDFLAPEVYWEGTTRRDVPLEYLVLESLPGRCLLDVTLDAPSRRAVDEELAEILAALHANRRETFGQLGGPPQSTQWSDIMVPRLVELRGDMEGRLPAAVLRDIDAALERAEEVLGNQGPPTLVHGDVWAGNLLVAERDGLWHLSGLVDWPALQYADVEYELAYLESWNTVGPAFFDAYCGRRGPLRPGYELRKLFYWLHTLMLHIWLGVGDDNEPRVTDTAKRLVAAL